MNMKKRALGALSLLLVACADGDDVDVDLSGVCSPVTNSGCQVGETCIWTPTRTTRAPETHGNVCEASCVPSDGVERHEIITGGCGPSGKQPAKAEVVTIPM
jgi:hypothetical protein